MLKPAAQLARFVLPASRPARPFARVVELSQPARRQADDLGGLILGQYCHGQETV